MQLHYWRQPKWLLPPSCVRGEDFDSQAIHESMAEG